jgi:hypothetical protein
MPNSRDKQPPPLPRARSVPPPLPGRNVVVNGEKLSPKQIETAARQGVRIADGDYWYDRVLGAWGFRGAPTTGLIQPGLELGGRLAEDASNGASGYFINGRHLPMSEVLLLYGVVGVFSPGRYWLDAAGNYGFEGGPLAGNIWMTAQASSAPRQGILSTYDKTDIAVIGG